MDWVSVAEGSKHKYYFNQAATSFCNTTGTGLLDAGLEESAPHSECATTNRTKVPQ